jgi:hypothetical protein
LLLLIAFVFFLTTVQAASELEVSFDALERHLAQQVFTDEGKKYFEGNRKARCNYASMENPHFQAAGSRLRILTKFSGRRSFNLLGICVGMGDAFDLDIEGQPVYRDGKIRLENINVKTGKTGVYANRVRTAIEKTLIQEFSYPVADEAKRIMNEQRGKTQFMLDLPRFSIGKIDVHSNSLVFELDFRLRMK